MVVSKSNNLIIGYKNSGVNYQLLSSINETNKLAIILPGAGYTVKSPALYYITMYFLDNLFDVLHINYQYESGFTNNFEEVALAIRHDVDKVIEHVLKTTNYTDFTFIGKSLGTIAMTSELEKEKFLYADAIWLTPLIHREDVYFSMLNCNHNSLCIIGDQDPIYKQERFQPLCEKTNFTNLLLPNANHSFDITTDAYTSIETIKLVLQSIEQFKNIKA